MTAITTGAATRSRVLRTLANTPPLPPRALPALTAGVAGIALLLGGWIAVAHEASFSRQVGYLNVAIGGLVVIAGGAATYLVEFRRQIRRRTRLVLALDAVR